MASEKQEFHQMTLSPSATEAQVPWVTPLYQRRKCRLCCSACFVILLSLAIVAIVLSQTIFKFRDPKVSLHDIKLQNISVNFDLPSLTTILELSLSTTIAVNNPNYVDFRYNDSRMRIDYHGDQVGVVELGAGTIRSRKTVALPAFITVDAIKLALNGVQDLSSNIATLNLNSVIAGRVNLANIVKKHVTVGLNCTVDVFIGNQTLSEYSCKKSIKL